MSQFYWGAVSVPHIAGDPAPYHMLKKITQLQVSNVLFNQQCDWKA